MTGGKRRSSVQQSLRDARQSVGRVGLEMKQGIDSKLLAAVRFVGLMYGPIDSNLPFTEAWRKSQRYRLPRWIGWRHALGGVTYLLLIVLVVTGVLLALYYRPSAQEAHSSIQHIVSEIPFGWLVRDLHHWASNLIVIAMLAHMARVFFEVAYKTPREMNWVIGVFLLLLVFAFGATGYLLPWDQWAYWTAVGILDGVGSIPVVGGLTESALTGDVVVSGATLSRYFALHVVVLPWIALALLLFHFGMVRKHRPAPPPGQMADYSNGDPFFPNHLLRAFIVSTLVLAVLITLAALYPRPMVEPADPATIPNGVTSTWIMADVTLALVHYLGRFTFPLLAVLALALGFLPLLDRNPDRSLRKRPVIAGLGVVLLAGALFAWVAGRNLESVGLSTLPGENSQPQAERESNIAVPAPAPGPRPVVPAPPEADAAEGVQQ